jgi:NADH pyrophosphatase NudC (nudix superfamily)
MDSFFIVEDLRMIWKPHVTVAAVIERHQRFLMVEEETTLGLVFNQPAGHLENGEDLIAAIRREVFEETAWKFEPSAVVSLQLWRKNPEASSFIRVCFTGEVHSYDPQQPLDVGILRTHWLSIQDIHQRQAQLRSPLVLNSLSRYLDGHRCPLSILQTLLDVENV